MKKKRPITLVLACALALTLLTACGHTHSAAGGWELNAKEHWQVCECGENINTAPTP